MVFWSRYALITNYSVICLYMNLKVIFDEFLINLKTFLLASYNQEPLPSIYKYVEGVGI